MPRFGTYSLAGHSFGFRNKHQIVITKDDDNEEFTFDIKQNADGPVAIKVLGSNFDISQELFPADTIVAVDEIEMPPPINNAEFKEMTTQPGDKPMFIGIDDIRGQYSYELSVCKLVVFVNIADVLTIVAKVPANCRTFQPI